MDRTILEIYGQAEVSEGDLDKVAAAELLNTLTAENEFSFDGMSDEEIEALTATVFEDDSEKTASAETEVEQTEELSEEMQEKVAEADYLGRLMAHAYVAELEKVAADEKPAGSGEAPKESPISKLPVKERARAALKSHGTHLKGGEGVKGMGRVLGAKGSRLKVLAHRAPYAVAAGAGAAALMSKKSSAETPSLDTLAEQRALEILQENGIEIESEKTSSAEDFEVLAQAVEARAMQMLAEAGYVSDETEATEE